MFHDDGLGKTQHKLVYSFCEMGLPMSYKGIELLNIIINKHGLENPDRLYEKRFILSVLLKLK